MPRIFGSASTGGGGTPGGATTQVQYNNAGAFGGITGATTDGTTLTLVAPVLGTPASATLTNATGLPPSTGLSTFVAPLKGGLGAALVPVIGDILAADSTTSFARIAAPAVGQVLKSNGVGVAPSWSAAPTLTSLVTSSFVQSNSIYANGAGLDRSAASNGLISQAGMPVMWAPSTSLTATPDTGLSRISAGVIGVGTGAQGSVAGGLQAATLALGGATIGSYALAVTGPSTFSYSAGAVGVTAIGNGQAFVAGVNSGETQVAVNPYGIRLASGATIEWSTLANNGFPGGSLIMSRAGAATLQHGGPDAASPVAQTIKFQDVVAGTSNTAGVNATIQAPAGTGTGAGGSLIFQVAPAGSSGSAKNAWTTVLTIAGDRTTSIARDLEVFGGVLGVTSTQFNTYSTGAIGFTNAGTGKTSADTAFTRLSAGIIGVGTGAWGNTTGTLTATYLRTVGVTVSALPAASAGNQGQRGFVTDATATTHLSTVAGGGANKVPVVSDGTNWIIG